MIESKALCYILSSLPFSKISPELWFSNRISERNIAFKICFSCQIRMQCRDRTLNLESKLNNKTDLYGIFGGLSARARSIKLEEKRNKRASLEVS